MTPSTIWRRLAPIARRLAKLSAAFEHGHVDGVEDQDCGDDEGHDRDGQELVLCDAEEAHLAADELCGLVDLELGVAGRELGSERFGVGVVGEVDEHEVGSVLGAGERPCDAEVGERDVSAVCSVDDFGVDDGEDGRRVDLAGRVVDLHLLARGHSEGVGCRASEDDHGAFGLWFHFRGVDVSVLECLHLGGAEGECPVVYADEGDRRAVDGDRATQDRCDPVDGAVVG